MSEDYYSKYSKELLAVGVTREEWDRAKSRDEMIGELRHRGMNHRRAVEIAHNCDLSGNPNWSE